MYAVGRTAEKIVERQLHLWLCQCPNKLSGWPTQADDSPGFQAAYAQLEGLCQAIVSELQSDLELHDTAVFPQPIQLHQITSAEYYKVRVYTFVASMRVASACFCHRPANQSRQAPNHYRSWQITYLLLKPHVHASSILLACTVRDCMNN